MIRGIDDFKDRTNYWLDEVLSIGCTCKDEEDEIKELKRIINLIDCDVIDEMNGVKAFDYEVDLNEIIDILSHGGKIKKLSEVNFDE